MIRANNLLYTYPGSSSGGKFSLRLAKLAIHSGETVAITGPSGSGKTTLLNIIAGILRPDSIFTHINVSALRCLSTNKNS